MLVAKTAFGILCLLAALYVLAMNWACVITSLRNKRKGIDRHHSTVPLVSAIPAVLAAATLPQPWGAWALLLPLLDIANLNLLFAPFYLLIPLIRNRRFRMWVVMAVAALVILALWFALSPTGEGPVYQRRHLNTWVEALGGAGYGLDPRDYYTAEAAVQSAGSNAIPYLLKWIQHEEPATRQRITGPFIRILPYRLYVQLTVSLPDRRALGATHAFALMRTNAGPETVTTLVQLAANKSAPQTASRATRALALIGPAGVPAIVDILQAPQHPGRLTALAGLRTVHPTRDSVPVLIPVVLACLTDTNPFCSDFAKHVLGSMDVASDDAVTALTVALEDPAPQVREAAARALSRSRGPAQTAVPALRQLLSDPNEAVREEATNTLRDIAPSTLTNAAPQ
jgi:hypothetical protein